MDNNYQDLQKEINEKILSDLHRVGDALEVVNFMSKFQHLSSINWKWVRSQNENTQLLLTEDAIKNSGFKTNVDATETFIFVPHEINGRRKFVKEVRYDISQTNAEISYFPNKIHDYTIDENRELLSRTLNIAYVDLKSHFKDQATAIFAKRSSLDLTVQVIHDELMSHVVNKYFGIDTDDEVKPYIESWLNMKQSDQEKIKVIDTVHRESKKFIAEVEAELDKTRASMQAYKQYTRAIDTAPISQPAIGDVEKPIENEKHESFSFDKLKKDLGLNDTDQAPVSLEDHTFKESQGAYSFINFLDAVGEHYPAFFKSQSTKTRGTATNGLIYDTLNNATYEVGDLRFEFNGDENAIRVHGSGEYITFDVLDGSLPEAFADFKEQLLNEIDRLQQLESEKAVENSPPQKQTRTRLTDDEINRADGINIVQFIQQSGIDLKNVGRGRYHSKEYSSLVVLSSNNKFYYNATGVSGGPIKFAQEMLGIKHFIDAVNYINNGEYDQAKFVEVERGEYVYDHSKQSPDFREAYNYLVNERKVDAGIVKGLHERKGLIRQDVYGNVLFPFKENDKIVGCSERRTTPKDGFPNQKIQFNSTINRGWNWLNGEPKNLKFFEDPIDALSYMSIHKDKLKTDLKDTWFISLHGSATKHSVVHYYMGEALNYHVKDVVKNVLESVDVTFSHAEKIFDEQGMNTESIQEILQTAGVSAKTGKDILEVAGKKIGSMAMCTDNDKAGWEIANGFGKVFANITPASNFYHTAYQIEIPKSKDWNDERKLQIERLEMKQEQQQLDGYVDVNTLDDGYMLSAFSSPESVSGNRNTQMGMEM